MVSAIQSGTRAHAAGDCGAGTFLFIGMLQATQSWRQEDDSTVLANALTARTEAAVA